MLSDLPWSLCLPVLLCSLTQRLSRARGTLTEEQAPSFSEHCAPAPRRACRGMRVCVCVHERACVCARVCVCEPGKKGTPAQRMCLDYEDRFTGTAGCWLMWPTCLCVDTKEFKIRLQSPSYCTVTGAESQVHTREGRF